MPVGGEWARSSVGTVRGAPVAAKPYWPATDDETTAALVLYRLRVERELHAPAGKTTRVVAVIRTGVLDEARTAWLDAHLGDERLGCRN